MTAQSERTQNDFQPERYVTTWVSVWETARMKGNKEGARLALRKLRQLGVLLVVLDDYDRTFGTSPIPNEDLLTLHQAANRVRVPFDWLKAEAKAGRVPCLKIGQRFLFDYALLVESLRKRIAAESDGKLPHPTA